MDELFRAVREAASPTVWSRGVEIVRAEAVRGVAEDDEAIELRVDDGRNAMGAGRSRVSLGFTVHLFLAEEDWSCSCRSSADVCAHVAASVIAVRQARQEGKDLPTGKAAGPGGSGQARVIYRLSGRTGPLVLRRRLLVQHEGVEEERKMPGSITAMVAGKVDGPRVLAEGADLSFEKQFGPGTAVKIPAARMGSVLEALTDVRDLALDELPGKTIRIGTPATGLRLKVEQLKDGRFLARLEQDPTITEIYENGAFRVGDTLHAVVPPNIDARLFDQLRRGRTFGEREAGRLVSEVIPAVKRQIPVHVEAPDLPGTQTLRPRLHLVTERNGDLLVVLPTLVYGDPPIARIDGDRLTLVGAARREKIEIPIRNLRLEKHLAQHVVKELGLELGVKSAIDPARGLQLAALAKGAESKVDMGGPAHAELWDAGELEVHLDLEESEDFSLFFESADGDGHSTNTRADAMAVYRAWQRGDAYAPLLGGGFGRVPSAWMAAHGHLVADLLSAREASADPDARKLPPASMRDLAALCAVLDHAPPPGFERLRVLLEGFEGIRQAKLPDDLRAELRGYQVDGVNWLAFLHEAGLGGLLADDMGLGKTLQALCVIKGRCLVVAPTSVLHNWAAEAKRFRPDLRVGLYHGASRTLDEDAELTLTTYGVLRQDIDALSKVRFDVAVLDEAQAIKNPDSKVARAAYRIEAEIRIAMTGTPVENRLEDLWSQFHFINRGLLGGRSDFVDRYVRPIAQGDPDVAAHLRERIRPFVLRRLKSEVAKELPPRTDIVLRAELSPRERRVYDAVRAATQRDIVEQLQAGGGTIKLLEALLRLRQAACHTALLPGKGLPQRASVHDASSKTTLLMETLDEVIEEGHKALVFSQWTSLLDIVEHQLKAASLDWCRLDGSTRDRAGVVARFQDDAGPPVMLLSLKAGGTGLNLTAADHVFLLDPWWNPAVEDQAADRAHRIGQDKPVMVHRLVTRDSVEERILDLQARKRDLAQAAVGDAGAAHAVTRDELLALLA